MDTRIDSQIEAVLGSMTSQRITTVPADARALHRTILRAFADTGTAPTRTQLADDPAPSAGPSLERSLETLVAHDLIGLNDTGDIGDQGEIAYAYPFSTRPTAHRVQLPDGARPYAMCAIDALGIPAMLDIDAVIISSDPHSGEPITVTVTEHGTTTSWQPTEAAVFLGARTDCWATTSAESCCGYLNFFASHSTAEAWAAEHPEVRGVVLDQSQALEVGVRCFGVLLQA